ncbi:MAG TPA: DUF58 domain-containing protein [Candidatus Obscuribacterales bacterium]
MRQTKAWSDWLETRWVSPSYGGWLLLGLAVFFFAAATNTMAGWLYVISGGMLAMLAIAALLPPRSLKRLQVSRMPIYPISAGDALQVELRIDNPTPQARGLLELSDLLPFVVGAPERSALETLAAQGQYRWAYSRVMEQRGVYRWHTVHLRTAAPFGLFWRRQAFTQPAIAVVYPQVLPLSSCPLVDEQGADEQKELQSIQRPDSASEGMTRALRPYRWGDPIRMVHWRSSARYGDLRVRELEVITGGQALVIALDSGIAWPAAAFEEAVIVAASLYFYALKQKLQVSLWTAGTGTVDGQQQVLEVLAATQADEEPRPIAGQRPDLPLVWLTPRGDRLEDLPAGSRWMLWDEMGRSPSTTQRLGILRQPEDPLQIQLQRSL